MCEYIYIGHIYIYICIYRVWGVFLVFGVGGLFWGFWVWVWFLGLGFGVLGWGFGV